MKFQDFQLHTRLLSTLTEIGFETPTLIQEKTIGPALDGRDVLGIAQTGTGKTAAFLLPLLTRMAGGRARARMPRCVVLEPTRELAGQVLAACEQFSKNLGLNMALLIGGTSSKAQEKKIDDGVDILIATPGRFIDQYERGKLLLSDVQHLVVDEADRMLDMGFIPDIEKICSITPFTKQTLLFSATMPADISQIAEKFMSAPVRVEVAPEKTTNENVTQYLISVPEMKKRVLLRALLEQLDPGNTIIFCNSKRGVGQLSESLMRHGYSTAALHGDIPQNIRTHVLDQFREQKLRHLVATDVAARGIDVAHVSHVFNFDMPYHAEDYVHRVGRTGRGGRTGTAYSFVDQNDERQSKALAAVKEFIQTDIDLVSTEEFGLSFDSQKSSDDKKPSKRSNKSKKSKRPDKRDIYADVKTMENDPQSFTDLDEIPAFLRK
ncbi:MAG: DEAD/DEAH box helicase [Pseudomonadota bacterium]